MHIPFEQLRSDAKIWIFQANRLLTDEEQALISKKLRAFTERWEAHQQPLSSSYAVLNDLHIVVGVDQSVHSASGCSIDTLMHLLQELGRDLQVDFFDRKAVAYLNGSTLNVASFENLSELINGGEIKPTSLIFNNLVPSKDLLETDWKVKAKDSWLKRYFRNSLAT